MKPASISELKQELSGLPPKKVLELCLRLARYKKENKELLSYLLFEAHDEQSYIGGIKKEMDEQFAELPKNNWYQAKKGPRKILKATSKYSKHTGTAESELDLLIHFCLSLKNSGIRFRSYKVLSGLYDQQLKKLNVLIGQVHEDLRFDYKKQLEQLQ
jgi:hypothetical protein